MNSLKRGLRTAGARCMGCRVGVLVWLLFLGFAGVSGGQTNEEINAGLQFNFAPPGARSLAMGGAFAGLADDATAAFANPAGLMWLTRSEVSLEGRHRTYSTRYPFSGSASGQPTGNGIDTVDGVELREFESDVTGLSFLSYAHVFGRGKSSKLSRLRLALYRHELAAFEAEIQSQGPFIRDGEPGSLMEQTRSRSRLAALLGSLRLDIVNHGVAVAYGLSDHVWLGAGLSYYDFRYDALTRRFATNLPARDASGGILTDGRTDVIFGPADFSAANESQRSVQVGEDQDVAATVGLIWKASGGAARGERIHWSAGVVYRQAPAFDFDFQFSWQAQAIALSEETGNQDFVDPGVVRALTGSSRFEVPDVVSAGWMWRPAWVRDRALTIAFEYARVRYSKLEPESNLIFHALRGTLANGRDVAVATCGDYNRQGDRYPHDTELRSTVPCVSPFLANFEIDDADELHLGFEYLFRRPVALRLGAWVDPDHQLAYDFGGRDPESLAPEDRFGFRFPEGEDELHLTAGLGVVFSNVQLDVAVDLSDRADIFSFSSVFRLP